VALNFDPLTGNLVVTPERASYSKKSEAKAATKVPPTMRGIFTPFGYVNPATGENFSLGTSPVGLKDQIGPIDIKNQGRFTPYGFNPNAPAVRPGEYQKTTGTTPIVTGLTPTGEVDRSQSDEYKATRARYDQLRKAGPEMVMTPEGLREKAVDYGLQEWAKANPVLAAKQEAAKYGTFNPLMQQTFGYQTDEAPDQVQRQMMIGGQRYDVDPEAIQYQIDQQRAAEMGSPNPLVQQENTANKTRYQAETATTAGMNRPIADRVEDYLRKGPSKETTMFLTQPLF